MQEKIYKKDEFIYQPGDQNFFLYQIISGKTLSFLLQGSKITPAAIEGTGSFIGTNSFFLKKPTKTYSIALEETKLVVYNQSDLETHFPPWLKKIAGNLALKTEEQMNQILNYGIRKAIGELKPLSIEEQRHFLTLAGII